MKLTKFPSIEQMNTTIKNLTMHFQYVGKDEDGKAIYDSSKVLPTVWFTGTCKLHGTNACWCVNQRTGEMWAQSRERILSIESDNAGFAFFCKTKEDTLIGLANKITSHYNIKDSIISIYGEWAGPGIQKGVGITKIPAKSFFIFDVKITPISDSADEEVEERWVDCSFEEDIPHGLVTALSAANHDIYNINDFAVWNVAIDLNDPKRVVNDLIKLTDIVEAECPVSRYFGIEKSVGEGIVWRTVLDGTVSRFKVKGSLHSSSKVKTIASVDIEKLNSIQEFVDYAATENRFNQAIEYVFTQNNIEPDITKTSNFIKWVMSDVIKEEIQTLSESGLEIKQVAGGISKKASDWFKNYLMQS